MITVMDCPKCKKEIMMEEYADNVCPECSHTGVWVTEFNEDTNKDICYFKWFKI